MPSESAPDAPILPYIPPHPQNGSPAHRYVVLLLPQSSSIPASAVSNIERLSFDVRAFINEHNLLTYTTRPAGQPNAPQEIVKSGDKETPATAVDAEEGGGIAMWRARWDESVSQIYREILGELWLLDYPSL